MTSKVNQFATAAATITIAAAMIRRASTSAPYVKPWKARARYPTARRTQDSDIFHTQTIPNQYKWLEDPDSAETAEFVTQQNINSKKYFDSSTVIPKLRSRMKALYNYPKFGTPFRRAASLFYFENNGLENQYRLMQCDIDGSNIKTLLDPNKLREDGTAALRTYQISNDGKYLAYGVSYGGSDWFTIFVKDIVTGEDLSTDKIEWCKFSEIAFNHECTGFYYCCYPMLGDKEASTSAGTETDAAKNQKIMYHTIGTTSEQDVLIYKTPEQPDWMFGASCTHDGNYLLITTNDSCDPVNRLYIHALNGKNENDNNNNDNGKTVVKAVDHLSAKWEYLYNIRNEFWFVTNLNAPKNKIVKVTLPTDLTDEKAVADAFNETNLIDVVTESENVLETAQVVANDVIVLRHLVDCKHELSMVHLMNGGFIKQINFPTIGTVLGITGRPTDKEIYFKVYNFLSPGTIYNCDIENKSDATVSLYRQTELKGFDPNDYIVEQKFATSKDGTKVPMFIVRQKTATIQSNTCLLYGYGGFNISLTPSFSTFRLSFLEQGATYVMSNLRGGGEYGDDWHNAGTVPKGNKQNVFDDFHACGEWLVNNGYTSKEQLCIQGGSNGGLLVAACCNQRPDLYSAGVAQVGVMDMLKFQRYTIGHAWCSDFGNADENEKDFEKLIKISPLHNVRIPSTNNVQFPSMLLTTGDHDDRVVPLHTLKLLAELQYVIGGDENQTNPILARISVNEGHGAGKPTERVIEEQADIYGFVLESTNNGGGRSSSL